MRSPNVSCVLCAQYGFKCHMCEDPLRAEATVRLYWWEQGFLLWENYMSLPDYGKNGWKKSQGQPATGSQGFLVDFATITEFLCLKSLKDGSPREPGTLLIETDGCMWRLKVRDRQRQLYAFYAARSLSDALAGVDLGLEEDSLDWRQEKPIPPGKK